MSIHGIVKGGVDLQVKKNANVGFYWSWFCIHITLTVEKIVTIYRLDFSLITLITMLYLWYSLT